ncbi:hypothetical protein AB0C86_29200 [Streptomyces lavendulae]|uniref:hypothetical protein n=1 Tax=Streptomyces lavendulae TaxID=1914 RepID=UPI0033E2918D
MTRRHGTGDPGDEAVDRWFVGHGRALADALGGALDIEAGLREVLVQSRHDDAEADLEAVLDEEAGLRAILPAGASADRTARPATSRKRTDAEGFFHSVSPMDRLAVRGDPEVAAAGRALDKAVDLTLHLDDRHLVIERAIDLAQDLVLDLSRARDLDFDIVLTLDPELDRGLFHALETARSIGALGFLTNRDREDREDRDLVRALVHAYDLNLARARGLDTARARAQDLNRVLDLAHVLSLRVIAARSDDDEAAAASDLARVLVAIRAEQVGRAIAGVLRREPPPLDEDAALAFLHDFTTADLRAAELQGIDLGGVYWSEYGTRWPAALDLGDLRRRSVETPAGSATWVVRWGTAEFREFAVL